MKSLITTKEIHDAVNKNHLFWKKHTLERMLERDISRADVKSALLNGKIIEQYPDDYPIPSLLIAHIKDKPLHVVIAYERRNQQCHIITTYRPNLIHFKDDLITRK